MPVMSRLPFRRQRPNNSFKPNALRYTNNMAEQLAMLLAPLRTSA